MSNKKTAAIVLAAGMGSRMKSSKPKVMHAIGGRPMINHLLSTLDKIQVEQTVVVVGPDMEALQSAVAPRTVAVQVNRDGTGDAVKVGMEALGDFKGDIIVLYGDTPLISEQTINGMLEARAGNEGQISPSIVVLGFEPLDPGSYGRLVVDDEDDELMAIVEFNDASPEQREIGLCNSGVMCFDGEMLPLFLSRLSNDNANGEYYLTDCVGFARDDGFSCVVVDADEEELIGVNSRADLAQAEMLLQDQLRERIMKGGATLIDPSSVYFSFDTKVGKDVIIEPNVQFGPGVTLGDNVTIKGFSHIEGAGICAGATVGPFARLRPGTQLDEDTKVGNFVEIKNAKLETGAKVSHLSYIGDARIGRDANVGAGTITCNYDGFLKHKTTIGAGAFIGSNTALVAPVAIGDGAIVGAGSTITSDVEKDAIVTTRTAAKTVGGMAEKYRDKKRSEKELKNKG